MKEKHIAVLDAMRSQAWVIFRLLKNKRANQIDICEVGAVLDNRYHNEDVIDNRYVDKDVNR